MNRDTLTYLRAAATGRGNPHAAHWIRDERTSLFLAALLWALIVYWVVPLNIFTPPAARVLDMSANPLTRMIKLVLLSMGALIVVWRASLSWLLLRHVNAFFLAFLALVPISYIWSISPGDTLARYISLLSTVFVGLAFCVSGWHAHRFQNVMRAVLTLLLCGSLIFGLLRPDLAIERGTGTLADAWHGLASQKNPFGQLASFGVVFWFHAWLARQSKLWSVLLFGGAAAACLWLSRSSTSLLATAFAALFMLMLVRAPPNLRRYMPFLATLFAIMVLAYALAVLNLVPGLSLLLDPIMAITGKDMTFSNRSEIWQIVKEHIALSPYIGSGYGAYWIGPVLSSPSYAFLGRMYFYPTESHNGYLEIVNDLGFVGLTCLLGFLVTFVRQSLQLMRVDRAQGALFLGLFFQQMIINLSESCWLSVNSAVSFTIMTCATIALARSLLERDLRSYFRTGGTATPPDPEELNAAFSPLGTPADRRNRHSMRLSSRKMRGPRSR